MNNYKHLNIYKKRRVLMYQIRI